MDRLQELKKHLSHPLCFLVGGFLLCVLAFGSYFSRKTAFEELEERTLFLYGKKLAMEERQKNEEKIHLQMEQANRVYIEEVLAKREFLKDEIAKLKILVHSQPGNEQMKERLNFLQNGQNGLRLKEQNFQRVGKFQEVEVVQTHPIEVSRSDLTYLLSQLEHVPLGDATPEHNPPYFLIKQFDLLKKPHSSDEETFMINLQMTKQEIVHD